MAGAEKLIDPDFKNCLRIIMAYEDPDLTQLEKQAVCLSNLFLENPNDPQAALEKAAWFLAGGHDETDDEPQRRLYSFYKDAGFIFAAFRQTHGIDLETAQMHWWKFLALFLDLGADTVFCNLVSLRKRVWGGTATKEERRMAQEMGSVFDLPEVDDRTPEEREAERAFMELIGKSKGKE